MNLDFHCTHFKLQIVKNRRRRLIHDKLFPVIFSSFLMFHQEPMKHPLLSSRKLRSLTAGLGISMALVIIWNRTRFMRFSSMISTKNYTYGASWDILRFALVLFEACFLPKNGPFSTLLIAHKIFRLSYIIKNRNSGLK